MKIGTRDITSVKIGSRDVVRVMLGTREIWTPGGGGDTGTWYAMSPGGTPSNLSSSYGVYFKLADGENRMLSGIRIVGGSDLGNLTAFVWEDGVTGTPVVDAGTDTFDSGYTWEFTPTQLDTGTAYLIGVDNDDNSAFTMLRYTVAQTIDGLTVTQGLRYRTSADGVGAYPSRSAFSTTTIILELKLD